MSKTRRPPEILRKSHAHVDVDERARLKRELLDALDEAVDDDGADPAEEARLENTSEREGEESVAD